MIMRKSVIFTMVVLFSISWPLFPGNTNFNIFRRVKSPLDLKIQEVLEAMRNNLRKYPHKEKKSVIEDLNLRMNRLEMLIQNGNKEVIANVITELKEKGLSWEAISRSVLSLVEVVGNSEEFETGLKFIGDLITDLDVNGRIDYEILNQKIVFLSESRLSEWSHDLEEFEINYRKAINWILGIEPIYSHEIIEEWCEEDPDIGSGNYVSWTQSREDREYVRASASFYAGGFLRIGDTNFVLDNNGVRIFTCTKFKSLFGGQKLGEEIVARTFQRAYEVAKLMEYNPPWAFAYWFLNREDANEEEITGKYFEDTERFKIINLSLIHI